MTGGTVFAAQPYFAVATGRSLLFWLTFGAWFFYVLALLRREPPGPDDRHTSTVLLVCTAGALALAFGFAYGTPATSFESEAFTTIGPVVVGISLALSEWARRCLGTLYHPVIATTDHQPVVTNGPYRVIRHPIYAARILSLAGLGLAMSNWMSLAVCIVLPVLGFIIRINAEERALLTNSGAAYAAYTEHTSRLLPGLW